MIDNFACLSLSHACFLIIVDVHQYSLTAIPADRKL